MSLINQMLDDLDKRTLAGTAPAEAGLLSGVASTNRRRKPPRWRWLGLLALLLVGAGAGAWMGSEGWPSATKIVRQAAAIPAPAVPEAAAAVRPASVDAAEAPSPPLSRASDALPASSPAAVENTPAALESLVLVQVGEQLRVAAAFSHVPEYRLMRQDRGRQLAIELPAGTKTASLPDAGTPPLLQKAAYERPDGRVRLVLSLDRPCRYDDVHLADNPDAAGQVLHFVLLPEPADVPTTVVAAAAPPPAPSTAPLEVRAEAEAPAAPAAPSAASAFVRQPVQPTARQRTEALCRKGITAFRQGRLGDAETALRAALAIEPGHVGARDALLQLVERQDRQDQFEALLAAGVREAPDHLPYRVRYVRLLIESGDLSQARAELTRTSLPSAAAAPDLHAMLATVNLRQGRYREAADTYRRLLAVRPDQAVWWMGLGIALEGDAAPDEARQAYGEALGRKGLSDGLRNFIRKRLAAARNVPAGQSPAASHRDEERS